MSEEEPEAIRRRLRRRVWNQVATVVCGSLLLGLALFGAVLLGTGGAERGVAVATGLLVGGCAGAIWSLILFQGRLRRAHELIDLGLAADALPLLKELASLGETEHCQSSACYLTGRAYQLQGANKLALAYYREYGKRFPEGPWAIEAKVQARELRRLERERKALALEAREETELRCPYCRDALLLQKPHVECETCGTRYHEDCHAERGGCSVFGCASAPQPEERVSA
jgi:hypothetical protein